MYELGGYVGIEMGKKSGGVEKRQKKIKKNKARVTKKEPGGLHR